MIHEKMGSGQFLIDGKNGNLLLPTHTQHQTKWFNTHVPSYNPGHPLTQQALYNSAIPQVAFEQICSAYAYQQQQRAQLIASHHQSAAEVLDLSQRESFESTSTMPRTPPPYQINWDNTESPARSRHIYANNEEEKESQQQQQIPVNLLYNAQHQISPFAPMYPTLYKSINNIYKEAKAATTPPQALTLTPPASNTPLFSPQPQTSPLSNDSLIVAATAAATNTPSTRHNVIVKSDDICIAPLSPISSHDGRSRSPIRSTQNVIPTNSSTPSSSDVLRALQTSTTRPFKAFPRDPLVIAANFAASDVLLDIPRTESYKEYRSRMLKQMKTKNGGSLTVTNPKMRRINTRRNSSGSNNAAESANSEGDERHGAGADESSDCDSSYTGCQVENNNNNSNDDNNKNDAASNNSSSCGQVKDAAYYERRRKNNAAAKKSRDRRRIKEDEIALRAAFLERQNIQLLSQITTLKQQLAAFTSKAVSA